MMSLCAGALAHLGIVDLGSCTFRASGQDGRVGIEVLLILVYTALCLGCFFGRFTLALIGSLALVLITGLALAFVGSLDLLPDTVSGMSKSQ